MFITGAPAWSTDQKVTDQRGMDDYEPVRPEMMLSGAPDHHPAPDAYRDIKKALTHSTGGDNALDRALKGRHRWTFGCGTGRARDSSDEEENRGRRKSPALRTSSKKKRADETSDRALKKKHRRCHPHGKVHRHSMGVRRRLIRGSGGARYRNCPSTGETGQETATAAAGQRTGTEDTGTLGQVHRHRRTAAVAVIGEHRSLRTGAKT